MYGLKGQKKFVTYFLRQKAKRIYMKKRHLGRAEVEGVEKAL